MAKANSGPCCPQHSCVHPPPSPLRPAGSIRWRMAHSHVGGGASGALQGLAYAGGMALGALQYGGMADNAVVSIVPHVRPSCVNLCERYWRALLPDLGAPGLAQPLQLALPLTPAAGQRADCAHRDDAGHLPGAPRCVPPPALVPSSLLPAAAHLPPPLGPTHARRDAGDAGARALSGRPARCARLHAGQPGAGQGPRHALLLAWRSHGRQSR